MRKHYDKQRRFDCTPIGELMLNYECRDEVVPVLAGLQHVYTCNALRNKVVKLVCEDINEDTRRDVGRPGLDDWQVVVLSAVRLGCNYDYDKLQDQCENHRGLQTLLGVGEWSRDVDFGARRIRDTLCQLKPSTLAAINQAIVSYGQELHGEAAKSVRADSFVVETNIHYPTESALIGDGLRKIIPLCADLANEIGASGWRQSEHLLKRVTDHVRTISRISASKSPKVKARLSPAYGRLLTRAASILDRAKALHKQVETDGVSIQAVMLSAELMRWIELTEQVCDTAHRRVILQEQVPNSEKLFSLFETHTQLYRRGKAGTPNQFGRMVLVFEDGAGFISHYHLMDRKACDADVIVEQTREAQKKHKGQIATASFDRGFYTSENEAQLSTIVDEPCLAPRHPQQYAERLANGSLTFHRLRQRHSGIESAIGALQSGNGLKRCRDHSELGFERYLGLAILGRNIHILGKLLIARRHEQSAAAFSKRQAA